jgi:flagellar export protein FliJ
MKRFHFSLQSVLAVREAKVDQVEATLAERQRDCQVLRERLARLRDAETRVLAELAEGQDSSRLDRSTLSIRRDYLMSIVTQIKALEAKLAAEQTEVIRLRQVLLECSKEEQIIEHLKKRKIKLFCREMAREQQAEIDEVANGRRVADAFRGTAS